MSTEPFKTNDVQNGILSYTNFLLNVQNDASSIHNEMISNNNQQWEILTNKYNQHNVFSTEKEKYSLDIMYVQGETQYIKMKIESNKEQINEIERLMQEGVVKLKEMEHEKDVAHDKQVNKHNAFKIATKYFKTLLHIYIRVKKEEDLLHANVCYFTKKFDDTYSFIISKKDNEIKWTLNSLKPKLENFQFMALQKRFNSSNNMPALLCTVRKIFMLLKNSRK